MVSALLAGLASESHAQYFGRNKVQYRTFDFKILKTDHFDIYYYDDEREIAEQCGRMAERWYARLSRMLDHELNGRQPLILYASHPDFEQTNAIQGDLDESTGGVTEYLKRRIVLPLAGPLQETDHVIGHELVHAFQFDITRHGASSFAEPGAARLPLWFVEGQAEYLSIGPRDPHTAMWIRDAVLSKRMPGIKKLGDPRYFPYRFGEALWAFVGGKYGDPSIGKVLKSVGRGGDAEQAILTGLSIKADSLSDLWLASVKSWNAPIAAATESAAAFGRAVIPGKRDGPQLNVGPALSPDGNTLAFLSERGLFSIEMYFADARTGKVLRKITKTALDPHYQSLEFIHSSGAFSPDGKRFAFAAVSQGKPLLAVIDVASGKRVEEIRFPSLGEIFNPTWSPDGARLAFSAMVRGATDLYIVDLASKNLRRLTNDLFADIEPAWSPDGRTIAFATDRFTTNLDDLSLGDERLAYIDPDSGNITEGPGFRDAKDIDPQWSPDGSSIFFVSDHGGISNLYRVGFGSGDIAQITNLHTGVSGITASSPAIATARASDRLVFSVYENGCFSLHAIDTREALAGQPPSTIPNVDAALLPPADRELSEVSSLVAKPHVGLTEPSTYKRDAYKRHFSLDYISQPSIGVAAGSGGLAVGGGTTLYWSDLLGDHNLATLVQVNNAGGNVTNNIALVAAYENRRSRWNWGFAGGQLPYVSREIVTDQPSADVIRQQDFRFWEIDREAQLTANYPFSPVQRIELSAGYLNIGFQSEVETRTYDANSGAQLTDDTSSLPTDPSLHLVTAGAALVYDASVFGGTSPVDGRRFRFEVSPTAGDLHYAGVLGDIRQYFMIARPLSIAGRVLHYGRYGSGAEDPRLSDLFIGNSWLVHGYDSGSFSIDELTTNQTDLNRLFGSRLAVGNVELRLPLLGPLGVIHSPSIPPLELAGFFDAGVAWRQEEKASFLGGSRKAVTSFGPALRLNLLGFAVGELAFVHPNDRPNKGWYWQFSLQPGF
jgi:dipeptidyl aminopeptidase/acylaminoacyl peptidase